MGAYGIWGDTIIVHYDKDKHSGEGRILEGDIITVYGTLSGLSSYKTIAGNTVTVPSMDAKYIDIN